MDTTTDIPKWLTSSVPPPVSTLVEDKRTTLEITYDNFFPTILELTSIGRPLSHIVRDDPRGLDYAKVLNWIHKDPKRKQQYYEAQEIGAEALADEMVYIADGTEGVPEDVQRSKLRIDTRWKLIETWNRKRYGNVKDTGTVNNTLNISNLLLTQAVALLPPASSQQLPAPGRLLENGE